MVDDNEREQPMQCNFEKLKVYQKALELANEIYSITKEYPKEEIFGLGAQIRRAAVSIVLNIAEGSARTKKEFSRFIDIARGSVFECMAILEISVMQK
ncbi:MAG: four helix bundle protein [Candidatus Omnitrophota bacterium]